MIANSRRKHTVSVVIPAFNASATIIPCLESVMKQSYAVEEVIVVNDGSSDDTSAKVLAYVNAHNYQQVMVIEQQNSGPSVARNNGISRASGELIAFLDADDIWAKDKLHCQLPFFDDTEVAIVGALYGNGNIEEKGGSAVISFKQMLFKNYFITPCVIIRKSVISEQVSFNSAKKFSEDYYLWLHIIYSHKAVLVMQKLAWNYFNKPAFGHSGLSRYLWAMEKGELDNYQVLRNKGYISFPLFIAASCFSFLKFLRRSLLSLK
ncbi:glycosyltransferase family 2 protein [Chitinophaga sp. Ak27]|uniref:glycosyltransferase family 2 protein n=1 Tax=Chitinophaga sp. Ak27 TaxID=2726116 RepID=UPI00145EFD1E|nr:glycosyltransferase family 2 protein [Chitinophaga sp. Ak27]NLU94414.1 glycosyltransferase family 2 protein [Chitinophaga sp. Ak27]